MSRYRKSILASYIAKHHFHKRKQIWKVTSTVLICFYVSMYCVERPFFSHIRELQMNGPILSNTNELKSTTNDEQRTYFYRQHKFDSFDDNTHANQLWIHTKIFQQEKKTDYFPRWNGSITTGALRQAIDIATSGNLRFDRVHRVYVISSVALKGSTNNNLAVTMHHTTVSRPSSADQAPYRRAKTIESFVVKVLDYVRQERWSKYESKSSISDYPYLNIVLDEGGFVYLANYADSKFCSDINPLIDENEMPLLPYNSSIVPIFTLSAPIHCQWAFPVPTYETIELATLASSDELKWENMIANLHTVLYPRSKQYRKAIWRGAPTGHRSPYCNQRIQLCMLAINRTDILDVKLVKRRKGWDNITNNCNPNFNSSFNEFVLLGDKISPMDDFQKYRAIIDVDGHSWSSRFGRLMCYNSVVLKVEPEYVDYFHPTLQPWVHYIPIHSNFSNLYDTVSFAISDKNLPTTQQIIQNANEWCKHRMNHDALVRDMAHIWDKYAYHLLLGYPNHSSYGTNWRTLRRELFRRYNFVAENVI